MLRGVHLTVMDVPYEPFFRVNSDGTHEGIDCELIFYLSQLLGFTYTIQATEAQANETWTQVLLKGVNDTDLVMSWWDKIAERMNEPTVLFLESNVDLTYQLVTYEATLQEATLTEAMTTFLAPFTISLWGLVLFGFTASGCIYWFLEFNARRTEVRCTLVCALRQHLPVFSAVFASVFCQISFLFM